MFLYTIDKLNLFYYIMTVIKNCLTKKGERKMLKNSILYINYINKKYNSGEIRHLDFIENNFQYKNIVEIENTYREEPIALLDFLNKYLYLYNKIIINLNNISKDREEYIINEIEYLIEYLYEIMDIDTDIIFINKKVIYKTFNYKE